MNTHNRWDNNDDIMRMITWVEEHFDCEVYLIDNAKSTNGFVEYRNGKNIIYILICQDVINLAEFAEILAHEAGHVLYNQRMMQSGQSYEEIVSRTKMKLDCFHYLLENKVITDDEYERLYDAIEEEWESNKEKERILNSLWQLFNGERKWFPSLHESLNESTRAPLD